MIISFPPCRTAHPKIMGNNNIILMNYKTHNNIAFDLK